MSAEAPSQPPQASGSPAGALEVTAPPPAPDPGPSVQPVTPSAEAVLDALAKHARSDDLARLVHVVAMAAADERRPRLDEGLGEAFERAGLSSAEADTPFGNVRAALEAPDGGSAASRLLLGALLARGVALAPPKDAAAEEGVVEALAWLASATYVDGLQALDAAFGDGARGAWRAAAALVRRADEGRMARVGRPAAVVALAALRTSSSAAARGELLGLAPTLRDPTLRALAADVAATRAAPAVVFGERISPPRTIPVLVLFGWFLAFVHVARLVARLVLRLRSPAELRVADEGITVAWRTELLGRVVARREVFLPAGAMARVSREVRFGRASVYAGLVALAVGSYVGASLLVDGAWGRSPELIAIGAAMFAVGLALDWVLETVVPERAGRCRVVLVPRKGKRVAVGGLEPALAERSLRRIVGTPPAS